MPADSVTYELRGITNTSQELRNVDLSFLENFEGLPICLSKEMNQLLDGGI